MFRVFVIFSACSALFPGIGRAQFRSDNATSTYYGQNYLIPTYSNPCHSATFNDHGQTVSLCIDNFGRPIQAPANAPLSPLASSSSDESGPEPMDHH